MRYCLFLLGLVILASSCSINKNLMFKTDRDFVFDQPQDTTREYRISPNDRIIFRLFTNNGNKLLQGSTSSGGGASSNGFNRINEINYTIEADGTVKLPVIGLVDITNLTLVEAEKRLEELYTPYFNDAFAQVILLNNRVIVFPGSGGDAQVIPMENRNTTVIEALAAAGGISSRGNASKVKLIRQIDGSSDPDVYLLDLSTIEGIRLSQMTVQAYDVIYVEPTPELASELLRDIAPIVSLISSFTVLTAFFLRQ